MVKTPSNAPNTALMKRNQTKHQKWATPREAIGPFPKKETRPLPCPPHDKSICIPYPPSGTNTKP
ncbi:hypothetical protein B0T16DRAFT_404579 [Cercophora newfieldiana]|uniref:Uncharacterized protein n=1 Tax=Cercophora newfieldiana TaxID=92897 RepID=A0AA40CWH1_9PEZI|nr:hypothetical protein B0T16DRAFT_404579 [Cercophora newfieldiana]